MVQNELAQLSKVDIAYHLLLQAGHAVYFRDLITQALEIKGDRIHSIAHAISEVHTQINMDSRFVHMGKGMWGLADWTPQRGSRDSDDAGTHEADSKQRREKLLEEIQEDFVAATLEEEGE